MDIMWKFNRTRQHEIDFFENLLFYAFQSDVYLSRLRNHYNTYGSKSVIRWFKSF